jgi:hypothetical protein
VEQAERDVRYRWRITRRELEALDYAEYREMADALQENRVQEYKDRMTAATFTAWQIIRSQGGKMKWEKHLKAVGLGPDSAKVNAEEKKKAQEIASMLHQKFGRVKK